MSHPRSLRSMLAMVTVGVAVLSLLVAGAMVLLTTMLQNATLATAASVESVHHIEEAEIDLLLHSREDDPLIRDEIAGSIVRKLAAARERVETPEGNRLFAEASTAVSAYLAGSRDPAFGASELAVRMAAAYRMLEAVVEHKLAGARANRELATQWNAVSNIIALGFGAVLLGGTTAFLVWLRRRAFRPVLALADAMKRFGQGEREARAQELGPTELREMSVRFNEMATALDTQRRSQLAFLGGVAHDLRSPLSALKMSLDIIGEAPAESQHMLGIANRQAGRLERMVDDFLDLAKLEGGELDLQLRREDLRTLIQRFVDTQYGAHDRFVLRLPPSPLHIRCDSLRIEQVVTNLISNALKYSPPEMPVELDLTVQGDEALLRVTDHGPGLSAEDRARLFEPFRRVGASKQMAPGIGLGLFIVRRIVGAHGGRIEVVSAPNGGSTFIVYLPVARGDADTDESRPS